MTRFNLLYHDAGKIDKVQKPGNVDSILLQRRDPFLCGRPASIGFTYPFGGKTYVITAAAKPWMA